MPPLSTKSKSLLIFLMLLAASEFIVRGPVRFLRAADFNEFLFLRCPRFLPGKVSGPRAAESCPHELAA
jgi:hypothetical protein